MTAYLDWAPPDGVEMLIEWLKPLGEVADERPTDAVLPFRLVHGLPGTDDRLVEEGHYAVYTYAATKPGAQAEAALTHRRVLLLSGNFIGQQPVTISTGTVFADNVVTIQRPHWDQWLSDNSMHCYKAIYRMDLRFIAAN